MTAVSTAGDTPTVRDASLLEAVFRDCFFSAHNTELVGGAAEPLYQPATDNAPARLYYREDYFASALHEVAHWCIAGEARRQQVDFGYWYSPDGRSAEQQRAFENVEYQPQALEWFFARACGVQFTVSVDNLDTSVELDTTAFRQRIFTQARQWQSRGLPGRAGAFYSALSTAFNTALPAAQLDLTPAELGL